MSVITSGMGGVGGTGAATDGMAREPDLVNAAVAQIRGDDMLAPFLGKMTPTEFARDVVRRDARQDDDEAAMMAAESHTEAALHRLAARLRGLDVAIRSLVGGHQGELLAQAAQTSELKSAVDSIVGRVARVKATMDCVRQDVMVPFGELRRHTARLARIQAASSALLRVRRLQHSTRRLRTLLSGRDTAELDSRDLAKAAQVLVDVGRILEGRAGPEGGEGGSEGGAAAGAGPGTVPAVRLATIPALRPELEWVRATRKAVIARTQVVLLGAMATLKQSELAVALQIFHDLGSLSERVHVAVKRAVLQVSRAVADALDPAALADSGSGSSEAGAGAAGGSGSGGGGAGAGAGSGAAAGGSGGRGGDGGRRRRAMPGTVRGNSNPAPTSSSTATWRANLWTGLESATDRLYRVAVHVWHLQRVLAKKRDLTTHTRLLDIVVGALPRSVAGDSDTGSLPGAPADQKLFSWFWDLVTGAMQEQIVRSTAASSFIRKSLVDSYPRLRALLRTTLAKLQRNTDRTRGGTSGGAALVGGSGGVGVGGRPEDTDRLLWTVQSVLEVYLARSLSRLTDPVNMLFPADARGEDLPTLPSRSDIKVFLKVAANELHACKEDPELSLAVSKGVVAATLGLVDKAEAAAVVGADAVVVAADWSRTEAQRHNQVLVCRLQQVVEALQALRRKEARPGRAPREESGPRAAVTAVLATSLRPAVESTRRLIWSLVVPLCAAVCGSLEQIIARIHDVAQRGSVGSGRPSRYLEALTRAIEGIARGALGGLPDGPVADTARSAVASRVLCLFVRHLSLIRPMDEEAKLALTQDMAQLELAVHPLAVASDLGDAYSELRQLRSLLFVDIPTLFDPADTSVLHGVRPSTLFHHLLSRGPLELPSPHSRAGLSASEYLQWMDVAAAEGRAAADSESFRDASAALAFECVFPTAAGTAEAEAAVWSRVRHCLDEYAQRCSSGDSSSLHEVYLRLVDSGPALVRRCRAEAPSTSAVGPGV